MTNNNKIRTLATKPLQMKLFMLSNLPLGLLAGLRITAIDKSKATVSVPFKYLNKNPFKSMYFAVMAMAAELSSGILALAALHDTKVPVSMLVLDMHADFTKKAKTKATFSCHDGQKIIDAIDKSIRTGEGETVVVHTEGLDESGDVVAKFAFTWTFKPKQKR